MKILIPAYQPNKKLIKLVENIRSATDIEIVVVDDGSGENYKKIFDTVKEKGVKVLEHKVNKGKGEAIKTGIKYFIEIKEDEGFVSADCDGQHSVKDIIRVAEELKKSNNDIVLGIRDFKQKDVPARSKFGNKISKVIFLAMTGEKIVDTQTGLRGYSKNIFELLLNISGSRYDYEFNILLAIKEKSLSYNQIKIDTIYEEKNKASHFRPIKDSILIYKPVCKFIISSLASAVVDFVLLIILQKIFNNLLAAVICSRIVSSILNFILNKNYVFETKNEKNILKMIVQYYVLVIIILALNYTILKILYEVLNINLVISKIMTEIILYAFSFIMQKRIVFRKERKA